MKLEGKTKIRVQKYADSSVSIDFCEELVMVFNVNV